MGGVKSGHERAATAITTLVAAAAPFSPILRGNRDDLRCSSAPNITRPHHFSVSTDTMTLMS